MPCARTSHPSVPCRFPPAGAACDSELRAQDGLGARCRYPGSGQVSRRRILELTDLVAPSREVWWSRTESIYHWWGIGGRLPCGETPSPCTFDECWYRSVYGHESFIGRFCHCHHAVSSTSCKCCAPPGPSLFLVCRAWCQDAQAVFFSANRFVVHDYDLETAWALPSRLRYNPGVFDYVKSAEYPHARFTASHFLRHVVPANCLAMLRFVELVFPPYFPQSWPQSNHPAMQDWRETVAWLQDKINGPGLTNHQASRRRGQLRQPAPRLHHRFPGGPDPERVPRDPGASQEAGGRGSSQPSR